MKTRPSMHTVTMASTMDMKESPKSGDAHEDVVYAGGQGVNGTC